LIARPASNLGSSVDVDHPFLFAIVDRLAAARNAGLA
jgi:serine protease inhibitor